MASGVSPSSSIHSGLNAAFGASGTYESAFKPDWIEEEGDTPETILHLFWPEMYASLREGKPFRVTDNDVLSIMRTISTVKAQNKKIMRVTK